MLAPGNITEQRDNTYFAMRPSQALAFTGIVTSLALLALGIATGGGLGLLSLGIGIGLGYPSYNIYQVLTNLESLTRQLDVRKANINLEILFHRDGTGNLYLQKHPLYDYVIENTLFFDSIVKRIIDNTRNIKDIENKLDQLDQAITFQPCRNLLNM